MPRTLSPRVLIAAFLLAAGTAAAAEPPRRVVSFNVCADQLMVAVAAPEQIAALSPYATNPTLSVVAQEAHAFRRIGWHAESVVPLEPDLVLVGPRDRSLTQRLLAALGFRVVTLDLVGSIAAAREQIVAVAALLGQPQRGEALLARLDAARARLKAVRRPSPSTALLIGHGGYAEGPASLAASLMAEAGLQPPPGAPVGIGGFVPLETLVMIRPDLLVLSSAIELPRDQGSVYLTHPALAALYPPQRRIILPARYTLCGGAALVAGVEHLADALSKLAIPK